VAIALISVLASALRGRYSGDGLHPPDPAGCGSAGRSASRAGGCPGGGVIAAAASPVLLVAGWTTAAEPQPRSYDVLTTTVSALAAEGSADRWVMTLTFAVAAACVPPRWRTGSRAADQEALQHAGAGVRHAEREQPRSGAPSGPLRKRARGQHIITESDNHGR
jgi:Protein of unknown function (DUF998)